MRGHGLDYFGCGQVQVGGCVSILLNTGILYWLKNC